VNKQEESDIRDSAAAVIIIIYANEEWDDIGSEEGGKLAQEAMSVQQGREQPGEKNFERIRNSPLTKNIGDRWNLQP